MEVEVWREVREVGGFFVVGGVGWWRERRRGRRKGVRWNLMYFFCCAQNYISRQSFTYGPKHPYVHSNQFSRTISFQLLLFCYFGCHLAFHTGSPLLCSNADPVYIAVHTNPITRTHKRTKHPPPNPPPVSYRRKPHSTNRISLMYIEPGFRACTTTFTPFAEQRRGGGRGLSASSRFFLSKV